MEILCPECQFSREVDESKIPAKSQVATCPKCKTKFRFRELPEEENFEIHEEEQEKDIQPPSVEEVVPTESAVPEQEEIQEQPVEASPSEPNESEEAKQEESAFPNLPSDSPNRNEALWDKLGRMTPPAGGQKTVREERAEAESQPSNQASERETLPQQNEPDPIPGWNGEFSEDFPDPMHDDAEDENRGSSPLVPPPFEQLDRYGFFHGLYMTVKLIITSPRLFFSVMPVGGGLSKPLTFTILLTMIQGFVQYFWGLVGLSASAQPGNDPIGGVSSALAPILMLLFMPALIAAGQFVITGIYHLLLILMRADNQGFEGTFRALAYANAPIILGIFPMPIAEIEVVWMAVAAIWGLFLTITGLKHIHKTSFAKVIPVALIPLLLGMIAALAIFQGGMATV